MLHNGKDYGTERSHSPPFSVLLLDGDGNAHAREQSHRKQRRSVLQPVAEGGLLPVPALELPSTTDAFEDEDEDAAGYEGVEQPYPPTLPISSKPERLSERLPLFILEVASAHE